MLKRTLLTVAFMAAGQSVMAQPVGAGGQIRQIPPAPTVPKVVPDIHVERGAPEPAQPAAGPRIMVRSLHVTGQTQFSEAELIAATGCQPGVEIDLAGLRALAARITDVYGRHGYFVAQAYLPAQDVHDGAVTIAVIEGHYGKVALNNQSRVRDGLPRSLLSGLEPGDLVATRPLERRLLLLSDLPGVVVKSTLSPGEAVGASDLTVDLLPGRRVTGSVEADNAGNPYTGEYRAGATVNFNEPLGLGDVASLRVLTAGSGLTYVRGFYEAQISALTVGVAYTHLSYELGKQFKSLNAHGTADIGSLYASYPLIRSRENNLDALGQFDARTFKDESESTATVSKRTARVGIFGLTGDHRDDLWGGGWTNYSVAWALGDLDIKTPAVRAVDAVTARTQGSYSKVSFDIARLQQLGAGPVSLYGEARGQLASKNLDSSEKMELGGVYGVRAYPEGEAYGDEGYLLTAEARLRLARLSERMGGNVHASVFVDNGAITINHTPWAPGDNHRNLSAAGVGLTWADAHGLLVKVAYAVRLGSERAISAPDRSGRVWVQLSKFF